MRRLTCNNWMAYLKDWTDNFFQIFFRGTSWVAVSINNIKTRASREMTSRKNIKIFDFNGVNVAKHWHVAGEVLPSLIALLPNALQCNFIWGLISPRGTLVLKFYPEVRWYWNPSTRTTASVSMTRETQKLHSWQHFLYPPILWNAISPWINVRLL